MDSNQLKDWGKKNNKFLKLENGESLTATLKTVKAITKDSFGEEKEVIRYTFETEDGHEKIFDNGSPSLADTLSEFIGKKIIIERKGEREKTRYRVRAADAAEEGKEVKSPDDIAWTE